MQKQKTFGGPSTTPTQKARDGSDISALAGKASAKAREALERVDAAIEEAKTQASTNIENQKVLICGVCYIPGCPQGPMVVMTVGELREGHSSLSERGGAGYLFRGRECTFDKDVPEDLLEMGVRDYKLRYGEG